MKKIKLMTFIILFVVLTACNKKPIQSPYNQQDNTQDGVTIGFGEIADPVDTSYTETRGSEFTLVFMYDSKEYIKNGENVKINGQGMMKIGEMHYISLHLLFDALDMPNAYEKLVTERELFLPNSQIKSDDEDIPYGSRISIDDEEGKIYFSKYAETIVVGKNSKASDLIENEVIMVPANVVDVICEYDAQYFPIPGIVVMYDGVTPAYPVLSENRNNSEKAWQQVYFDVVNGTDPLGMHYFPSPRNGMELEYPGAEFFRRCSIYDIDKDGTPELILMIVQWESEYFQVFGFSNGTSKYLGDIYGDEIEKSTGIILGMEPRYIPLAYRLANGRFSTIDGYVVSQFDRISVGGKSYSPDSDEIFRMEFFEDINDAIENYMREQS